MAGDLPIPVSMDAVAAFCLRYGISRLALFGSVLRADFRPDSDVDVLVEFAPGGGPGFTFFRMQEELAEILGRRVDLNTPGFLGRHVREHVLKEARTVYVAA